MGDARLARQRHGRHLVVAVDARDFLDDVGLAVHIGAPGRCPDEPGFDLGRFAFCQRVLPLSFVQPALLVIRIENEEF